MQNSAKYFLVLSISILAAAQTPAQNSSKKIVSSDTASVKKNNIEASLFGAIAGFYKVSYLRTIAQKRGLARQLSFGFSTVPKVKREKEGYFLDASLWLGYRHFFWKGLHADLGMVHSYAQVTENPSSPNKTFNSYGFSNYALIGYQFTFAKSKPVSYYLNIQPLGFYYQWIETDKWNGQGDNRSLFLGIDFGIKF